MPGWFSRAAARASRSTRSPPPFSSGIALTATSRSSFSSQPSQTTPKPPAPSRRSSRYRPRISRGPGAPGRASVGSEPPSGREPGSFVRLISGRFMSGSVFGPEGARPAPRSYSHATLAGALKAPGGESRFVSFLDEPDEPVRTRRRPPRGPSVDRQTLMARRGVAIVGVIVLVILFVLLLRGCPDARKENAMEDYADRSAELIRESKLEGDALFELLQSEGGTDQVVEIQNELNGYRVSSSERVDRARGLDVPDEVSDAHRYLLDVLELRRDGLAQTANAMRTALGDQDRREGTQEVTEAMQVFLASDAIDQIRFRPRLREALEEEELAMPRLPTDTFVPDVEWLDASFVADQVNALRSGTGGGDEAAAPGLHGNGIAAVALGGATLTPGAGATVTLTGDLAFEIQVQNQGEHTETDVNVIVSVGEGDDALELEEAIDTIAPGEIQTVTIPLTEPPPTGQNVPITVEVDPVPGEEYTVIFTG